MNDIYAYASRTGTAQEDSSEKRGNHMSTNGIGAPMQPATLTTRRRNFVLTGIALRLFIAFVISWLIILAFFVSGAVSH